MTSANEIKRLMESGVEFWNHETMEYVYYDPDFDEGYEAEERGVSNTCCLTMAKFEDGYVFAGTNYDDDADRDEMAHRITHEYGWIRTSDPLTRVYAAIVDWPRYF